MDDESAWWWWQRWADKIKWMRRWTETWLARLTQRIREFIPDTRWYTSEWVICDFENNRFIICDIILQCTSSYSLMRMHRHVIFMPLHIASVALRIHLVCPGVTLSVLMSPFLCQHKLARRRASPSRAKSKVCRAGKSIISLHMLLLGYSVPRKRVWWQRLLMLMINNEMSTWDVLQFNINSTRT